MDRGTTADGQLEQRMEFAGDCPEMSPQNNKSVKNANRPVSMAKSQSEAAVFVKVIVFILFSVLFFVNFDCILSFCDVVSSTPMRSEDTGILSLEGIVSITSQVINAVVHPRAEI